MRTPLKHIKTTRKHLKDGSTRTHYYHRHTGKKIVGAPGSPEFLKSYEQACRTELAVRHETLGHLINVYKRSQEFARCAPRTRMDYDKILAKVADEWGDMPLAALEDRRIRQDVKQKRDQIALRSLRQADYFVTMLGIVVAYGVDIGLLNDNHVRGIGKLYKSYRSEKIWLPEHVTKFLHAASPQIAFAFVVGLHTGQREGDLLRLSWKAYDGTGLTLRQSKTGTRVYVPCTQVLKTELDSAKRRDAVTILTNRSGHSWTPDGFRSSFRKTKLAAGIDDLTFNDLRGTAVTMLSEAGANAARNSDNYWPYAKGCSRHPGALPGSYTHTCRICYFQTGK